MKFSLHIDTHAHLYDCFNLEMWVRHALKNLSVSDVVQGIVVVVDREGQSSFERLRREVPTFADWKEHTISEELRTGVISLDGQDLIVIPGVQYISAERLEVLALGTIRTIPDGHALLDLIEHILSQQATVCLPWSPWKWLGRRGAHIRNVLNRYCAADLCLGDISVHAQSWPKSRILNQYTSQGFKCLVGTDALERPNDCSLVGSYGIICEVEGAVPAADVISVIRRLPVDRTTVWGAPNGLVTAIERFISSLL